MNRMKQLYYIRILLAAVVLCTCFAAQAWGQITGVVTDSVSGEPLMYVTVQYEGKGVGAVTNVDGEYKVETRRGGTN